MSDDQSKITNNIKREMSFTASFDEQQTHTDNSTQKDLIDNPAYTETRDTNELLTQQIALASKGRCLSHPEEELQFFCYDNTKILCAECMVKGEYTGMEIVSLRRAAEKIRTKLKDLLTESNGNLDMCQLLENEVGTYEVQINDIASNQKEEITKKITTLRQALDQKELELVGKVETAHSERQNKVKLAIANLGSYRQEMTDVKATVEDSLSSRNDMEICQFYSMKADYIKNQLNAEINPRILKSKKIVERYQSKDRAALQKLQEGWEIALEKVQAISYEAKKEKSDRSQSPVDPPKIANRVTFAPRSSYTKSPTQKISLESFAQPSKLKVSLPKDISITESLTILRPENHRMHTSLSRTLHRDETSPVSSIGQLSSRTSRPAETEAVKNSYISPSKSQVVLESYREKLSSMGSMRESQNASKPKNVEVTKPSLIFNSKLSTSKLFLDSNNPASRSPMHTAPKKWSFEPMIGQIGSTRNIGDSYSSMTLSRNGSKSSLIKNEELDGFDYMVRPNSSKNASRALDSFRATDNKLRQKLEKLSNTIFNQ